METAQTLMKNQNRANWPIILMEIKIATSTDT